MIQILYDPRRETAWYGPVRAKGGGARFRLPEPEVSFHGAMTASAWDLSSRIRGSALAVALPSLSCHGCCEDYTGDSEQLPAGLKKPWADLPKALHAQAATGCVPHASVAELRAYDDTRAATDEVHPPSLLYV